MQQQFADLGVQVDVEREEGNEADTVEVWDANWKSFSTFLDCSSRWRWLSGMSRSVRLGLDLAEVDVLLRRRRLRGRVFNDLLIMEAAALEAFAEASP